MRLPAICLFFLFFLLVPMCLSVEVQAFDSTSLCRVIDDRRIRMDVITLIRGDVDHRRAHQEIVAELLTIGWKQDISGCEYAIGVTCQGSLRSTILTLEKNGESRISIDIGRGKTYGDVALLIDRQIQKFIH